MAPSQPPVMKMAAAPARMELWVNNVIHVRLAIGDFLLVAVMVSAEVF